MVVLVYTFVVSKSINPITIIKEINIIYFIKLKLNPNILYVQKNSIPVNNSIKGFLKRYFIFTTFTFTS